jgi:RNA polymerase sigma factor (sigma-70 family)
VYQTTLLPVRLRVEADAAARCGSEMQRRSEMATNRMSEVIQHLRRTVVLRDGAGLTDGQLLEDYISRRDEAALATLVRRHGPMVWGVCRRVLRNYHDAEDAFQTTFLVLVSKAASIVPREMVPNWLYGVAHQTALKARATAARRRGRERQMAEMPEPAVTEQEVWRDLQPLLDEELSRLPDKYRAVIVLCDLESKTRKEAARQLGCPEGTVAGRLARARLMLAKRMARHGLAVSGGALAAVLTEKVASAGVPPSLLSSTIKAVTLVAAGQAVTTGMISVKVAALTEGVLKTMLLTKLKTATVVVLLVALALTGGAGLIYRTLADEPSKVTAKKAKVTAKKEKPVQAEDEAKAVIEKVLKAHGGEERLKNIKAFTMTVKTAVNDNDNPFLDFKEQREYHYFVGLPDRVRLEREIDSKGKVAKLITVCNGDKRWSKVAGKDAATEAKGKGIKELAEALGFMGPRGILRLTDPAIKVSLLGEKKVGDDAALLGDRVAICIGLARKDGKQLVHLVPDLMDHGNDGSGWKLKEVKLYFDKDNGLLVKEEFQFKEKDEFQQDRVRTVELFYSNYKLFNGIPVAQKMIRRRDGQVTWRTEIVEFNVVDKLEAKLFQRP